MVTKPSDFVLDLVQIRQGFVPVQPPCFSRGENIHIFDALIRTHSVLAAVNILNALPRIIAERSVFYRERAT